MATTQAGPILRHIRSLLMAAPYDQLADADLLGRFLANRDEMAFTALYRRYGRLVWSICGRILRRNRIGKMRFRRLSSCWRGKRARSGGRIPWEVGFMGWPIEQP
jgi:hypothetical protein